MSKQHIHFPRTTAGQRKLLFETWEANHDVTTACRRAHVARGTFYYWQPRFETGGYAALEHSQSRAPKKPARTAPDIEQRVIDLRRHNPQWGKRRIADELAKANCWEPVIRPNTVKRILIDAGLWTPLPATAKKGGLPLSVAQRTNPARRSM
ncbi:MAG: helix-turn-helix domain-containing protein [Chloroflexi bacterium]|nr:helix-turn-helix domain-containing protein [Chloroflexota bacterium]